MTPISTTSFVDRRNSSSTPSEKPAIERRQFTNSHDELSRPAKELAVAVDQYKLRNKRRFITYEELHSVITSLGYTQAEPSATNR